MTVVTFPLAASAGLTAEAFGDLVRGRRLLGIELPSRFVLGMLTNGDGLKPMPWPDDVSIYLVLTERTVQPEKVIVILESAYWPEIDGDVPVVLIGPPGPGEDDADPQPARQPS